MEILQGFAQNQMDQTTKWLMPLQIAKGKEQCAGGKPHRQDRPHRRQKTTIKHHEFYATNLIECTRHALNDRNFGSEHQAAKELTLIACPDPFRAKARHLAASPQATFRPLVRRRVLRCR